jgi:hypothetical protein
MTYADFAHTKDTVELARSDVRKMDGWTDGLLHVLRATVA